MSAAPPRLMLVTPPLAGTEGWAERLLAAAGAGDVAAVLLRLAPADERSLINHVKAIAPALQARDIAVLVEAEPLVAMRGGADGVHVQGAPAAIAAARETLKDGRSVGVGHLRSRHDAMDAGEAGADYVMFGEPRPDGTAPPLSAVIDRAGWWAEIFQTPCVAFAATPEAVAPLSATGAEFVALGDWAILGDDPAALVRAAMASFVRRDGLAAPAAGPAA